MFADISYTDYVKIYNLAYIAKIPGVGKYNTESRNAYFARLMNEYRTKRAKTPLQARDAKGV